MGAGNVQDVFDRYANRLPWRTFAALIFMAKTSIDAHYWPYYSAGLDALAAALFRTERPSPTQQRDVRRLVRDMVNAEVLAKTREASSLRKREKDRPAEYRLNIHERADAEFSRWKVGLPASTGVSDPSTAEASTGVNHPPACPPSTGVSDPASTGVFESETAQAQGSETPARSTEEEKVEEYARASGTEPYVPRRPAPGDSGPSPRCINHNEHPTQEPCRGCGDARARRKTWDADREATEKVWRAGMAAWLAWADQQPVCDCGGMPGGNLVRPDTGDLRCPRCRKKVANHA